MPEMTVPEIHCRDLATRCILVRKIMYLTRYSEPEAVGYMVAEYIRCGKPGCRCGQGRRHGPYWYLHYRRFENGRWRPRKRYVPAKYQKDVRNWLEHNKTRDRVAKGMLHHARQLRVAAKNRATGKITHTELATVCEQIQGSMENDIRK